MQNTRYQLCHHLCLITRSQFHQTIICHVNFFSPLILPLICEGASVLMLEEQEGAEILSGTEMPGENPTGSGEHWEHRTWCFLKYANLEQQLFGADPWKRTMLALAVAFFVKESTSSAEEDSGLGLDPVAWGGGFQLMCLAPWVHWPAHAAAVWWTGQRLLGWPAPVVFWQVGSSPRRMCAMEKDPVVEEDR